MSDFASGVMMRLLLGGMAHEGMSVPAHATPGAHVTLESKRALIGAVMAQGGHAALLRLAMGIERIAGDPIHQALASAADPHDFFARWHALERYMHSRHRVELVRSSASAMTLKHWAPHHKQGPTMEESLLVLGVIAAGFAAVGAVGLTVKVGGEEVIPTSIAPLARLAQEGKAGQWELAWERIDVQPRRAPAEVARHVVGAPGWPQLAVRIAEGMLEDLSAGHTLQKIARRLGTSGRSLQRELARHGLTLSNVMAETRSRAAAWWLCQTDQPVAAIGFLCGFADQPHFTRAFTQQVGLTPGRYRIAKSAAPSTMHA